MSEHKPAGEQRETFHICTGATTLGDFLFRQGTYQYERPDGTTVHGDASGEWTLDANGDFEDIVFFASPRSMGYGRKAE
ncbi:MAG TPA: hypothetical protein VHJ58_14925 [Vicinamibacterales bacterium]|jgi:hypothetical protein|nr:hypothetical protein [Vicinamibacterales bacterium]